MSKFPACGQHQLCYQSAPGPSSSISTGSANCRQKETSLGSCCHDQRIWKFRRYSIYKIVCKTKPHLSPPPNSSPFSLAVVVGRRDSLSVPSWPSSQTSQAFCSRAPPELSGPALTCCPGYPQPTKPRQESTMTGKLRERNETYSRNGNLPSWSREFWNQCLSPKATSDPHKGLLKPRGPQLWSPSSSFEQHNRLHKPNIAQVVKTLPKRDQTVVLIRPPPKNLSPEASFHLQISDGQCPFPSHPISLQVSWTEREDARVLLGCVWGHVRGKDLYLFSFLICDPSLSCRLKRTGINKPRCFASVVKKPYKIIFNKGTWTL